MRAYLHACVTLTLAGVLMAGGFAAQRGQAPPVSPTFRGSTTVVPIDVRVIDKQGRDLC